MLASGLFLVFGLGAIVGFAVWIVALVEALRTPDDVWRAAGQDRLVWIIVIAFLTFIGALLFFAIARPELRRAGALHAG